MIVKDDQPQLKADIELVFTLPPAGDRQESVRTVDRGHGRIETHNPTTSAAACRRLAAQPAQALALIGIEFEN